MNLQKVENLGNSTAKLTVEMPIDAVEKALDVAYKKQKNKINIQGFRKGKAPRAMIEKIYGAGIFYEDAANEMINNGYPEAAEECGLEIVARPEIEVVQIEKGKEFIFTAEVVLKPEVELGEYKGVEVAKPDVKVVAADVNAELEKIREQNARIVPVEDRAVKNGDDTVIDFEGFVDGEAFDGGKGEDYPLTIGSHSFIDTFEEQLIGKNIGQELEINVTFPEEYHAEELKGKPAVFKVTIKEIKAKELPDLDDDFAQDVSEFDTLKEYKADLKKQLVEKKEKTANDVKENEVIEKIIENSKMDIHEKMIESQTGNMVNEFAQRLQTQGLSVEQYMQFTGLTMEALMEQMKPQATKRIESRLVLEEVVKAENITITDEEFDSELERISVSYQISADEFKNMIGESDTKNIKSDIAIQKAADFVVKNSVEVAAKKTEDK